MLVRDGMCSLSGSLGGGRLLLSGGREREEARVTPAPFVGSHACA